MLILEVAGVLQKEYNPYMCFCTLYSLSLSRGDNFRGPNEIDMSHHYLYLNSVSKPAA